MNNASPAHEGAPQYYLVGGGIACLSAAALLIRDGRVSGDRIHVLEQSSVPGGSLDGAGSAETGYVIRGGRMFEEHFVCTYDLFDSIPTLDDPHKTVTREIHEFTRQVVTSSKSRLVSHGRKIEAPPFELRLRDKCDLARLALRGERSIGTRRIDDYFAPSFFQTNFWYMWCTMFAFQPWHSLVEFRRYMRRFIHLLPGFNRLEGIYRTRLNQYDSLVLPLVTWLQKQGAHLQLKTAVKDIEFEEHDGRMVITRLHCVSSETERIIDVQPHDGVLITLGSMTEGSSLGTMDAPPEPQPPASLGAWALWSRLAARSDQFGRPQVFASDIERTRWESFTVTLRSPAFFEFMEQFTGNPAGTGGLVTFKDSNWLMSVVLAHQPHFANQPEGIHVFWGYGLFPDHEGNHVRKKMSDCSGRELLEELFFHLRLGDRAPGLIAEANCIPCMMPFITSQFMPCSPGDRPEVRPRDASNFAFVGQFCELPEDTVFTVEYSIRSAQTAVYQLLGLPRHPSPMYRGIRNPLVILRAAMALCR